MREMEKNGVVAIALKAAQAQGLSRIFSFPTAANPGG
jgi:hypothetical protein